MYRGFTPPTPPASRWINSSSTPITLLGQEPRKGGPMSQKRIQQIEQRIDRIKKALLEIGPMRPGSLSRQYKDPQHQAGAYWQISYTRRMKSRTEYVRREW